MAPRFRFAGLAFSTLVRGTMLMVSLSTAFVHGAPIASLMDALTLGAPASDQSQGFTRLEAEVIRDGRGEPARPLLPLDSGARQARMGLPTALFVSSAFAADWQWSIPLPPPPGSTNERPRAFLWIPPECNLVRGVVFGHHNMEEEAIFEHPGFRRTLAEIGFAVVWVAPTFDRNFRFDQGAGERFDQMMAGLAAQSGYSELTNAPLGPCGHSAAASLPWYLAAWKPERVIAGVSFSGQWPYVPDPDWAPPFADHAIDSVPGIVAQGEYEWVDETNLRGLKIKNAHPLMPLSALGCPADGHFAALDDKIEMLALYVKKAAQYRLPKNYSGGAVKLNPIDVTKTGWLAERYATDKNPSAPAAPVGEFKGNPTNAFWYFDGELAKAVEAFQQKQRGKPALLGYVQNGQVVPQQNGTHQQVTLKFLPEADGVTFKLAGAFLDTVPEGRPERWSKQKAGERIEPPQTKIPIEIRRICGPIQKISADTWRVAFDRASFLNDRRGNEAWLAAVWPGDAGFKRVVQQAVLRIPGQLNEGQPQTISFAPIANQKRDVKAVSLKATSDSGLPVGFFVREGPAEIAGDTLQFTAIPPRAKFPVKVTVGAYQFGRMAEPKVPSAAPVFQEFWIEPVY
jgi:hypothetical protein